MIAQILIKQYGFNHLVLVKNIDGLTHEESLVAPPSGCNCVNWVLGHVLAYRNAILDLIGAERVLGDDEARPYRRGAPPLPAGGAGSLRLEDMQVRLDRAQQRLIERLGAMSDRDFARLVETPTGGDDTLACTLGMLEFHEAYHAGQIGILRRLLGKGSPLA